MHFRPFSKKAGGDESRKSLFFFFSPSSVFQTVPLPSILFHFRSLNLCIAEIEKGKGDFLLPRRILRYIRLVGRYRGRAERFFFPPSFRCLELKGGICRLNQITFHSKGKVLLPFRFFFCLLLLLPSLTHIRSSLDSSLLLRRLSRRRLDGKTIFHLQRKRRRRGRTRGKKSAEADPAYHPGIFSFATSSFSHFTFLFVLQTTSPRSLMSPSSSSSSLLSSSDPTSEETTSSSPPPSAVRQRQHRQQHQPQQGATLSRPRHQGGARRFLRQRHRSSSAVSATCTTTYTATAAAIHASVAAIWEATSILMMEEEEKGLFDQLIRPPSVFPSLTEEEALFFVPPSSFPPPRQTVICLLATWSSSPSPSAIGGGGTRHG